MLIAIKGEIDSNTIIVGDFKTPCSPMDRATKMKINKETYLRTFYDINHTARSFLTHLLEKGK